MNAKLTKKEKQKYAQWYAWSIGEKTAWFNEHVLDTNVLDYDYLQVAEQSLIDNFQDRSLKRIYNVFDEQIPLPENYNQDIYQPGMSDEDMIEALALDRCFLMLFLAARL